MTKRKLIEVAIPLEAINTALVLFAQLVDDPSGHPSKFPTPKEVLARTVG